MPIKLDPYKLGWGYSIATTQGMARAELLVELIRIFFGKLIACFCSFLTSANCSIDLSEEKRGMISDLLFNY